MAPYPVYLQGTRSELYVDSSTPLSSPQLTLRHSVIFIGHTVRFLVGTSRVESQFEDATLSLAFNSGRTSGLDPDPVDTSAFRRCLDLLLLDKLLKQVYEERHLDLIGLMLLFSLRELIPYLRDPYRAALQAYLPRYLERHRVFSEYWRQLISTGRSHDEALRALLPRQIAPVIIAHKVPLILVYFLHSLGQAWAHHDFLVHFLFTTCQFLKHVAAERRVFPVDGAGEEAYSWSGLCMRLQTVIEVTAQSQIGWGPRNRFEPALGSALMAWKEHFDLVEQQLWSSVNVDLRAQSAASVAFHGVFTRYHRIMMQLDRDPTYSYSQWLPQTPIPRPVPSSEEEDPRKGLF